MSSESLLVLDEIETHSVKKNNENIRSMLFNNSTGGFLRSSIEHAVTTDV
jgi:hypothetical protein